METVTDYFGSLASNKEMIRSSLPKEAYQELKTSIAYMVTQGMKNWAFSKGTEKPNTSIRMSKSIVFLDFSKS